MSNSCDILSSKNNSDNNNNNNNLKFSTFMSFNELDNYIKIFANELEMLEYNFLNQSSYVNGVDYCILHNENNLINLLNSHENTKNYVTILEYSVCYLYDELVSLEEIVSRLEANGAVFSGERSCYRERCSMYDLLLNNEKRVNKANDDIREIQRNIFLYKKYFNEEYPIISIISKHLDLLINLESQLNVAQNRLLENEKNILKIYYKNNLNTELNTPKTLK